MQTIHDVDALLLMATMLASKRRPADLVEIMAAADLVHGSVPAVNKLVESFARLGTAGLLIEVEGGFSLTPAAQLIVEDLPKKSELTDHLLVITERLYAYRAKGEYAPVVMVAEQFSAAINAHRAAARGTGKNLLVPKPKPEDRNKKRPGQRQRKPLPARKRRD